jgi:uncharacterized membrane protein YdbT with pleckstrin-like domain
MIDLHEPAPNPQPQVKDSHHPLHFPTQRPGEHVILFLRRHWSVLAKQVSHVLLLFLIPPVALGVIYATIPFDMAPGTVAYVAVIEGLSIYYLFTLLAYFHGFIDYHLDIWIVTDQRVISIEQQGLFNRVISELNIGRVQDVTSEMKGKVQTFLHFGQVRIQTAGEEEHFVFEQVPQPDQVARVILQVHDRVAKTQELEKVRESEEYRLELDEKAHQKKATK